MAPDRERQIRQQQHHEIGDKGRMTGVRAPKNVPRDSRGNEDPNAFFNSRESGASTLGRQSFGAQSQADRRMSQPNRPRYSSPVKAGGRGRERPDLYIQDGERGRKTGIRVPQQERDAQGFEDLDAFFDKSSPQTVKTSLRKPSAKKQPISPVHYDYDNQDDDDDDDGSREMDIDNNNSYSPSDAVRDYNRSNGRVNQSTSSLRKATATANSRRIRLSSSSATSDSAEDEQVRLAVTTKQNGSSSKLKAGPASRKSVARREPSDDDSGSDALQVIEPTTESDEERVYKGGKKSRASLGSVGVSRKGKERARSLEEEEEDYRFDDNNADYGGGDDGYMSDGQDGGIPFEDDQPEGDHDETGEDEEDAPQPSISKTKTKANGKGKAKSNGKAAKAKAASKPKTKVAKEKAGPAQSNGRRRLVNKPTLEPIIERKRPRDDDEEDDDGVRRSHRTRVEPVEYWRNERVIYKRRASGMGGLAMDAVVKIPKGEVASLTGKKKGATRRGESAKPQSRGRSVKPEAYEDEDGVDDLTDPDGIVWSWEGNAETTRRIAFTAKMIDPRPTYNNKFMFQKVFTELDYLASGILQIPAGAEKPSKAARDNSYTFYCIEGAVSVVVHRSRFNIGPGGTFFVPRGNSYAITAISNRDVKLFFTQARRVFEGPGGETRPDTQEEALARLEAEQAEEEEGEGEEAEAY